MGAERDLIPALYQGASIRYPVRMDANQPGIPIKPYFLRAYYDWIVDNGWTPFLLVDATGDDVAVPREHVRNGQIVLNVTPRAVRNLEMDNEAVTFSTRFGGVAQKVYLPVRSILAIYPEESGQALSFPPEPAPGATDKSSEEKRPDESLLRPAPAAAPKADGDDDDRPSPVPGKGRPALRIVKD